MPNFQIGYSTHTDWLAALDSSQPVNALSVSERSRTNAMGLALIQQVIVLSQIRGNGVHYLRLVTDAYQSLDGHSPLDTRNHARYAESAWDILAAWLAENNLTVCRALIAFPKTVRLLEGHADGLMAFDKEMGWNRVDRIDPAVLDAWEKQDRVRAAADSVITLGA